jgi:hypothetical protein
MSIYWDIPFDFFSWKYERNFDSSDHVILPKFCIGDVKKFFRNCTWGDGIILKDFIFWVFNKKYPFILFGERIELFELFEWFDLFEFFESFDFFEFFDFFDWFELFEFFELLLLNELFNVISTVLSLFIVTELSSSIITFFFLFFGLNNFNLIYSSSFVLNFNFPSLTFLYFIYALYWRNLLWIIII